MASKLIWPDNFYQPALQGADDYVTKPFKRNEFLARIKAQLGFVDYEEDGESLT